MSKYKETEIGLIPTDWNIYSLNKYIKKDRGICYGVVQPGFHDANGIPVIRVNNVRNGRITADDVLKVSPEIEAKYKRSRLEGNEILITLVGNVGEIAIVDPIYKDWNVARAVGVLPIDKSIDRNWLKYWLQSSQVTQYINSHCNTTVQITLNLGDVSNLPILEPSIEEQKRIADILSCLDAKIDNLRQQNETLEEIARSIFKHWFTDFEFPNADGKPYKSSGGAMVRSDLGDIPEGWRVGKLENVTKISTGKSLKRHEFEHEGIYPVLGANGEMGRTDKFLTESESILTGRVGTLGTVNINYQKAWISDNVIIFDPVLNSFYYVYFVLKNTNIKNLNRGSTQPLITQGDLKMVDILMPDIELIKKLEITCRKVFNKKRLNEQQIQTLTKTRDALLPKLMSGQLRVKE
jgi:type I restriction enzyme, S subunit